MMLGRIGKLVVMNEGRGLAYVGKLIGTEHWPRVGATRVWQPALVGAGLAR